MGEDVKVFEEFEIIPRYNNLNRIAKELLSDFKEVDNNFKTIIRQIYQQQTENLQKKKFYIIFSMLIVNWKTHHKEKVFTLLGILTVTSFTKRMGHTDTKFIWVIKWQTD